MYFQKALKCKNKKPVGKTPAGFLQAKNKSK